MALCVSFGVDLLATVLGGKVSQCLTVTVLLCSGVDRNMKHDWWIEDYESNNVMNMMPSPVIQLCPMVSMRSHVQRHGCIIVARGKFSYYSGLTDSFGFMS